MMFDAKLILFFNIRKFCRSFLYDDYVPPVLHHSLPSLGIPKGDAWLNSGAFKAALGAKGGLKRCG